MRVRSPDVVAGSCECMTGVKMWGWRRRKKRRREKKKKKKKKKNKKKGEGRRREGKKKPTKNPNHHTPKKEIQQKARNGDFSLNEKTQGTDNLN